MAYTLEVKEKAIALRKRGYSIKEVAEEIRIAKSTSSLWLRDVKLGKGALDRLRKRKIYGQYKAHQTQKLKREKKQEKINKKALRNLSKLRQHRVLYKLLCSVLFWAEGSKDTSQVTFVNSNPRMVATFVRLLRFSFPLEETKFRAFVHIHEYHDELKMMNFWSKVTGIPLSQFTKSYKKPNTKKRKRIGYKGCVVVRYYDSKVALELNAYYNTYAVKILGV
jgi:hypothetical protein